MLVLAGANDSLPHAGAGRRWSRRTRSCHIGQGIESGRVPSYKVGSLVEGRGGWPCRRHGEGRLRGTSWRTAPLPSCGHLQTGRESYRPPFTQREAQGASGAGVHGGLGNPGECVFGPPEPEDAGPADRRQKEPGDSLARAALGSSAVVKRACSVAS